MSAWAVGLVGTPPLKDPLPNQDLILTGGATDGKRIQGRSEGHRAMPGAPFRGRSCPPEKHEACCLELPLRSAAGSSVTTLRKGAQALNYQTARTRRPHDSEPTGPESMQ